MATVTFYGTNCSYIAHAAFTVSPDPYPNGIPCPAFKVANISTGTKITIYASEVTPASGYDFPVDVYVNDVYVDYLQSTYVSITPSDGMTIRLVATKTSTETTKGSVVIDREAGVAGYGYTYYLNGGISSGSSPSSSTRQTIAADADTEITITSFSYETGFASPVKITEYTDSNRTTVKKYWYWPTDPKITVSGTRYIGFEASLKTYTLTYNANGTGVLGMPANETAPYNTYLYISDATPTRNHYEFLGWSESSAATEPTWIGGGAGIYMNADRTLYAVWLKNEYQGELRINLGPFFTSGTQGRLQMYVSCYPAYTNGFPLRIHYNGTLEQTIYRTETGATDYIYLDNLYAGKGVGTYTFYLYSPLGDLLDTYTINTMDIPNYSIEFNANGGVSGSLTIDYVSLDSTTYTIPSTATPSRDGYEFLGWSGSSTAAAPSFYEGSSITISGNTVLYAVWKERPEISSFYWDGADGTTDDTLIATGQPVSNITATRWNDLLSKIKELADAVGADFTYTTVSSGDGITAARFNVARNGLSSIKTKLGASNTTLPASQSKGGTMYAALFNGSTSLKGALNDLIEIYNSEYR